MPNNSSRQQYINCLDAMLDQSKELRALTNPLYKHFGISNSCYCLLHETGESLFLESHDKLHADIIQNHIEAGSRLADFAMLKTLQHLGFYLLDAEPDICEQFPTEERKLFQQYDIHHQFISLDRIQTARGRAFRLIYYSAPKERSDTNRFYLNNLDLMNKINNYLSEGLEETINKLTLTKPTAYELKLTQQHFQAPQAVNDPDIRSFVKETKLHYPKHDALAKIILSQREKRNYLLVYIWKNSTRNSRDIRYSHQHGHHPHQKIEKKAWLLL